MSIPDSKARPQLGSHRGLYRKDIDGLRAVAVLLVLGFHAFPDWVPGGFVGVDVFFVISGYLITGIIVNGLQAGTFRSADFYARRARRLFPSLLVVSLFCLIFGWAFLLPDEYAQLGKHVFAGAAFISNFAFWREAGYFDNAAHTKPLLHLWSLGIEEQFYLVWPIFIAITWRRRGEFLGPALLAGSASFLISVVLVNQSATAAYYFPASRFWELLLGGLVASRPTLGSPSPDGRGWALEGLAGDVLSMLGLGLIALSVVTLDQTSLFPGVAAIPAALGAALVIGAGPRAWANNTVLSAGAMVGIGLISFPLYLWHWPLLSFARILAAETPPTAIRAGLLVTSFVAAGLTYLFVEKPIRFAAKGGATVLLLVVGLLCVGGSGLLLYFLNGVPSRFSDPRMLALVRDLDQGGWGPATGSQRDCPGEAVGDGVSSNRCRLSSERSPSAALIGDSHAVHLFPGLAEVDKAGAWLLMARAGCPPVQGISVVMDRSQCEDFGQSVIDPLLRDPGIKTVVLSFASFYVSETVFAADHVALGVQPALLLSPRLPGSSRGDLFARGLDEAITALERGGKTVVIFMDIPELPFFPRDCLRRSQGQADGPETCRLPRAEVLTRQHTYRELLTRIAAAHPGLSLFDPTDQFCDQQTCTFRNDAMLFYRDSHHLSLRGSAMLARRFLEWMAATGIRPTI